MIIPNRCWLSVIAKKIDAGKGSIIFGLASLTEGIGFAGKLSKPRHYG